VAVLGTGIMGSAMALNLVRAGLRTTVWDRTPSALAALVDAGAQAAASPEQAVRDANVVITMLPTADVVASVVFGGGMAQAFARGAVWTQMGTIGVDATTHLARRLAEVRPDVLYVFSAIAHKTVWLGEAGRGSRMKLVVNAYLSILIEGVAEALELADRLGIEHAKLAEVIEGGPLDAPIANAKLHKMEAGDFAAEFPLAWALKDLDLALASAGADPPPLVAALSRQWHAAVDAGLGRADISAARLALAKGVSSGC
jgi:3-hydroxyisobutyrate dehydrogenase